MVFKTLLKASYLLVLYCSTKNKEVFSHRWFSSIFTHNSNDLIWIGMQWGRGLGWTYLYISTIDDYRTWEYSWININRFNTRNNLKHTTTNYPLIGMGHRLAPFRPLFTGKIQLQIRTNFRKSQHLCVRYTLLFGEVLFKISVAPLDVKLLPEHSH